MTVKEAKSLKIGDTVYDVENLTKRGKPRKWKVYAADRPFTADRADLGRPEREDERVYPYRVRVGLKARFGEWETLSELELYRFSLNPE